MCGFVAVIGKPIEKPRVIRALELIRYRGPDDVGVWQDTHHNVSLGHTRLSIIDLQGGVQPLTNHDESLAAVVNGELYGHKAIRHELMRDGYQFKTKSDSEIVLGLYERHGVGMLKYLRGEFAFVIWDKRSKTVFAARDYFGIKPLFYREDKDGIYFASEAKAFIGLGFPLTYDDESFYRTICMFPNPDESLFSGVKQIRPAHYMLASLGSRAKAQQSYWDFNYPKEGMVKPIAQEEAALSLREVFTESVRLRLEADVPVACYLSGGIDSCAVLGVAQSLSKKPIEAFTLTFDHQAYDESKEAMEMAKMVNAPFNPIAISQTDIAQNFEQAVWHGERFLINGHAVAKYLLSRAVRDAGFKVVLTGEGSDEIFGGYAHFRQDQINHGHYSEEEKVKLLLELKERNKVSSGFLLSDEESPDSHMVIDKVGFLPGWIRGFSMQRNALQNFLSDDINNRFKHYNLMASMLGSLDIEGQVKGRDCLSKSLYLWSRHALPYYLLTVLGDRMEMAHSIEGRLPFLDHKVVEYVVSLPSNLKIKDLVEKYILRQAVKPYITKTIYERQKHPFLAPPASLSQANNSMTALIEDTLRGPLLKEVPYFDYKKIGGLLDEMPRMDQEQRTAMDGVVLSILSTVLLHKRMKSLVA